MSWSFEKYFSLCSAGTSIPLDLLGPCQIVQSKTSPLAEVGDLTSLGTEVSTLQAGQNISSVSCRHLLHTLILPELLLRPGKGSG